jgi:biotin carboxylase
MKGKKILMLGGADIQVSVIKKAKELGCYVITCDYLPKNPGHKYADEYHNVSTTDKDAVLALAQKLKIDGVLAYASDPAAPTAAFVAEKMGLPTNPYNVVEIMSRKDLFRDFMQKNGFLIPLAKAVKTYKEAKAFHELINKKAIIKPVDSSGSKGIFTIDINEDFNNKFQQALSFSRLGIIVIEEYIYKKGYQIGGDGFLVNGQLVFRCFGDIHFSKTNSLLPCSVSIPTLHEKVLVDKVHDEVQKLLSAVGMKMGALNFDILVDENNNVYILEIGPRNGGNMIPELTEYCTGVDMKVYSIKMALGEDCSDLKLGDEKKYFSHYVIHAQKSGIIKAINKTDKLQKALLYEHYNFKVGDTVHRFNSSANRLGIMLLKYQSKDEMLDLIYNMDKNLIIDIEKITI